MSGDEFVALLRDISQPEEAETVAQKMLETVCKPIVIHDQTYAISASIGISLYPIHGDNEVKLMKAADAAMYRAKEQGKNSFCLFDSSVRFLPAK